MASAQSSVIHLYTRRVTGSKLIYHALCTEDKKTNWATLYQTNRNRQVYSHRLRRE